MPSIEIHFEVEVLVALFQDLGAVIRIDVIHILPVVMFFGKSIPVDFKLESIVKPMSVDVFLHDPEVFIVDFDRQQCQFLSMWDHIGNGLGKDINMKHIVNFPFSRQIKVIYEV
jgi:hypothetical protein